MNNKLASNNYGNNEHPREWPIEDLMIHLKFEMNYTTKRISRMTRQEMIDAVLKNEIDQE